LKNKIQNRFRFTALLLLATGLALGGCASVEKPKPTVGQTIGGGIDNVIRWTSEGIKSVAKR
jgi:hypothetical protein